MAGGGFVDRHRLEHQVEMTLDFFARQAFQPERAFSAFERGSAQFAAKQINSREMLTQGEWDSQAGLRTMQNQAPALQNLVVLRLSIALQFSA